MPRSPTATGSTCRLARCRTPRPTVEPLLTCRRRAVVVEAVKLAEDRTGDVVVRLYEAHGARATTDVSFGVEVASVRRTDLLERDLGDAAWAAAEPVALTLRPFEIVTLRVDRA